MENLITLEAGNTSVKLAEFDSSGTLLRTHSAPVGAWEELLGREIRRGQKVACASTSEPETEQRMISWLHESSARVDVFRQGGPWPIHIQYGTPDTLGADRVLHAIAAGWIALGQASIIISCGTALVMDLVDESGVFLGGSISPGLGMRFQALHAFTGRLPLINEWDDEIPDVGETTKGSILSGVVLGMADEINSRIDRYRRQLPSEAVVFLTGGAAPRLANHLRNINFADPHLIHRGLFRAVQLQSST